MIQADMKKYDQFGTELKKLRINAGLTQNQLALEVGVDTSYVSKIENGLLPPPSEIILTRLAEALNVDLGKLIKLSGRIPEEIAQELESRAKLEFGPKLKDLRDKAGMSQHELAKSITVNPSYISKLENGTMPPPSRKILVKLAAALDIDEDILMVLAGKMKPRRELKVKNPFRIDQFDHLTRGMGAMNIKSFARVAVAILLVMLVGTSLWFASPTPVQAITVNVTPTNGSGTVNQPYNFTVTINVENLDKLPVQSVDLQIFNSTMASTYKATSTGLPMLTTTTTFTSISAVGSSGTSGTISITTSADTGWGGLSTNRWGYGYAYSSGDDYYTFGPNLGYGYGYSTYMKDISITYTVTWTPPSDWPAGTYEIRVLANGDGTTAFTTSTTTTVTLSAVAAGPGPGAPPAPPVGDPLVTDVSTVIDASGEFTQPLTIESRDGNVSIEIDEGTTGLSEAGRPLAEITVDLVEDPPPPPAGTNTIGVPYDFGPDGATFDPPITITFSYSPNQLPTGADTGDLSIAYYDQDSGEWVELAAGDITVDPVTGTITARVSHFTQFGIIVHTAPAEFELSGLVFPTMGVNIAEPATISAMVTNIGDIAGTYQVTLKINGEAVSSKTIKLNGGEYRKVSFTTVLGKPGDYKVEIDGLSGTLTVKAPAVAPVIIAPSVPQVVAPSAPTVPTAPVVPAAPAPIPAPTPWTAIIIVLVVAVIVGGILVWNYGFRNQ